MNPKVLALIWVIWPSVAVAAGAETDVLHAARAFESVAATSALFKARSPWQDVFDKILAYGRFREADGVIPAMKWLEDVRGARTADHVADYASLFGGVNESGKFVPFTASLVSEDWRIDGQGNWRIDQWLLSVGLDGSLQGAAHILLVETQDGRVLADDALPASDAEKQGKAYALLAKWRASTPAAAEEERPSDAPRVFADFVRRLRVR